MIAPVNPQRRQLHSPKSNPQSDRLLESTIRYDHHLASWPGDDWHSVALATELISSSATAMDELALVTRASLAIWTERLAPSSRIS